MSEETKFEDAESYAGGFGKDKIQFKDICLMHLKKIGEYAAVEMRGGFWETRENPISVGGGIGRVATTRIYIPDSREVYSNAVEYFYDILFPHFDKEMLEAGEEAEKELEKAFNDNTIIKERDREDQTPEQAEKYEREFKNVNDRISFRSKRVNVNRKLFRAICCFLFRKRYLEIGSIED